jgi:hypothetical protein
MVQMKSQQDYLPNLHIKSLHLYIPSAYQVLKKCFQVLERCVFITSIKEHAFSQINSCQHGFISGKTYVTELIEVLDTIGSQLDLAESRLM